MADSPNLKDIGQSSFNILLDGSEIPGVFVIASIETSLNINKIGYATIRIFDGNAARETFSISEEAGFDPGKEIVIKAGYQQKNKEIFKGIIVGHGIRIRKDGNSELVLKVSHPAIKMTASRKNAYFLKMKDSDIINQILGDYGLAGSVDATKFKHPEVVQYNCSDWDFIMTRAEANGLVIVPNKDKLDVVKPEVSGSAVVKIKYGESIVTSNLEIDAKYQLKSVECAGWDMSKNEIVKSESAEPKENKQGDWTGKKLAEVMGNVKYELHSSGPLDKQDMKEWASARLLKSRLARIRGSLTFQGSADAAANSLIEIEGMGKHMNGNAFISGVTHRIEEGDWYTTTEIGLSPNWFSESQPDIQLPPGAGLLPGIGGLYIGVAKKIHEDPDGEHRIQVDIPVIDKSGDGVWARLSQFYASKNVGSFFVPEVGDELILGFIQEDPRYPIILGSLHSKKNPAPFEADDKNTHKGIVTKSEMKLVFDDDKKNFWIETPGGHKLTISDENKNIIIEDSNKNKIEMSDKGITIDTPKDFKLTAKGKIDLDGTGAITIKSKADVKVEGLNVSSKAQVANGVQGTTAEVKGSAQTTIKGGIVMIN